MLFRVDTVSSEPIFEQIAHQVRVAVSRGDLVPGDKLPPARQVAAALEVNLHTVLHAYQILRDEGHIELRRGRGALVTAHSEVVPESVLSAIDQLVLATADAQLPSQTVLALVKEALK
ncbi:GntR family transcriptional regulator [Populibacterium corticicola]|jgi:GntR family transcriptional regulator|uniref:GntR family transcriptional regulator n=1 Tax=Populibacterium corticicola TaxID=1812826 RepID=A0ABW5XIH2_9MICO